LPTGYQECAEDYLYSSAGNYAGLSSVIEIIELIPTGYQVRKINFSNLIIHRHYTKIILIRLRRISGLV